MTLTFLTLVFLTLMLLIKLKVIKRGYWYDRLRSQILGFVLESLMTVIVGLILAALVALIYFIIYLVSGSISDLNNSNLSWLVNIIQDFNDWGQRCYFPWQINLTIPEYVFSGWWNIAGIALWVGFNFLLWKTFYQKSLVLKAKNFWRRQLDWLVEYWLWFLGVIIGISTAILSQGIIYGPIFQTIFTLMVILFLGFSYVVGIGARIFWAWFISDPGSKK